MGKITFNTEMKKQLETKALFEQAKTAAYRYMDNIHTMDVYPSESSRAHLKMFDETMPDDSCPPSIVLKMLESYGSENTVAQTGGKYFGFVCGGSLPVTLAAKWMTDVWDQNSAVFVQSPIAAELETICEKWMTELLGLPSGTAAGFESGSSTAILCALAAARNEIFRRQNWNVDRDGLFGTPPVHVVVSKQAHGSVFKALSLLGLGRNRVILVPVDSQGRMIPEELPALDRNTLLILQAGNVNTGAFDPIDQLCHSANAAGTWVHIDGAFGLWAAASEKLHSLVKGIEKADSWSLDAHKTLNAPYDSGIVLFKKGSALMTAMQLEGSYIQYSKQRDGMLYTPEMSRRARSIELWSILKYLGKKGVQELVESLCSNAHYFSERPAENSFTIQNDVVFNQILVTCETADITEATLKNIQKSGKCWCGGTIWNNSPAIRISVCSWQTTQQDIDECVTTFCSCRKTARESIL
jgi:glutamate/tyrosine decarboxylase-like PLP-dependent enzyme